MIIIDVNECCLLTLAFQILCVMFKHGRAGFSIAEIESLVSLCIKGLENLDQISRRAFADLVAQVLAFTQMEGAGTPVDVKKGGKADTGTGSGDEVDMASTPEASLKTMIPLGDMLQILSTPFNKPATSRKTKIGILDFYSVLFSTLGPSFIEGNYASIVQHLMNSIVSHPRPVSTRYESLLIRKLVGILLREVIGVRMLTEQGQIGAITELSSSYLKKWPALMPGQVPPSPRVLVVALYEVSGLLQQLGNAPPPVQVSRRGQLMVAQHRDVMLSGGISWSFGGIACIPWPFDQRRSSVVSPVILLFNPASTTQKRPLVDGTIAT